MKKTPKQKVEILDVAFERRALLMYPFAPTVRFECPESSSVNSKFWLSIPNSENELPDEPYVKRNVFYIHEDEFKNLITLLKSFNIPDDMEYDIILCYLGMCFASTATLFQDENRLEKIDASQSISELCKIISLQSKKSIDIISIDIQYKTHQSLLPSKIDNFHFELNRMNKVMLQTVDLIKFNKRNLISTQRSMPQLISDFKKIKHQNHEKKYQFHYASALLEFLNHHINNRNKSLPPFKLSKNICYLFIGKLMIQSYLIYNPKDYNDDDDKLIDFIKKKIGKNIPIK